MIEYKQPAIVAELRRRIQEGIYTSLLPTTAELAAEFGVNVKTMGKAIARLVAEGRLERRRHSGTRLPVQEIAILLGIPRKLTEQEAGDLQFSLMIFLVAGISCIWFLGSRFFAGKISSEREKEVDAFFQDMNTPVTEDSDEHENTDSMQFRMLGMLCLAYGALTLLGVFIPNGAAGRICFLFIGSILL